MVVCFLLLILLISKSSPSPALRISEINPGDINTKEIMDMVTLPKMPSTKRSLGLLNIYINNVIRHIKKNNFLMKKKNFGVLLVGS